jgi:selenocysteine-specific elongation factor
MMPPARHFVLATAGHVDHGKSTLVQALTGTDPDRLPEEKRRGMTIDLGFARLLLSTPDGTPLQIGLVDVPGHEDFVKNMVAGVGAVDAALLVIAADDGPMPQTREHLEILTYLGIRRGVIALTKADLEADTDAIIADIRAFVAGSSLESAPIVTVSAKSGSGLELLKRTLAEVLTAAPASRDQGKPRLAIDRAFSIRGAGTVVTGTLTGGALLRGEEVIVQPSGKVTRIRGIQSHGLPVDHAEPGSRVALNLTDVHPETDDATGSTVGRGDWLTSTAGPKPSLILDAALLSPFQSAAYQNTALRDGVTVKLHLGTAVIVARVQWDIESRRFARLRLERPALVMIGDRFVLRSMSDQQTLAGGVVLDAIEKPRRRLSFLRDVAQHAMLVKRFTNPADGVAAIQSALERDRVVDRRVLFPLMRNSPSDLNSFCQTLQRDGQLCEAGPYLVRAEDWTRARQCISQAVASYHQTHPQQQGLPLTGARRLVQESLGLGSSSQPTDAICEAMIATFAGDDIQRTGTVLRRADHQPVLPPKLQAAGQVILDTLRERPFDPPSAKELARNDASHQALKYLIATGQVIDLGQHTVLSATAYASAIEQIRHQLRVTGSATVSELKAMLGSSRRVMVPLLERLDRDRITRREGDLRFLI